MEEIERRYRGEDRLFRIYTLTEAKELGFAAKPWQESEVGGWAITDDEYVVECLERYQSPRKAALYTLSIGKAFTGSWSHIYWEERKRLRRYGAVGTGNWVEKERRKLRTQTTVAAYVAMVLSGLRPDWDKLGRIYRWKDQIPAANVKRLFKQKEIREMVREEFKAVFAKKGIDYDYVVDLFRKSAELAEKKGQANVLLEVARELTNILDRDETQDMHPSSLPMARGAANFLKEVQYEVEEGAGTRAFLPGYVGSGERGNGEVSMLREESGQGE